MAVGTPRPQPVCMSWGAREGGQGTCMPRPWPFCAHWDGGEATWHLGCPGCSRSVLAAAGGRTLWDAAF